MKPTDIKGLVEMIQGICTKHYGIAEFRCDAELNFDDFQYTYPLVYLEREKQKISTRDVTTYTIALMICDKPLSKEGADVILTEAKIEYLTKDISRAIQNKQVNLVDVNSITYDNQGEDMVMINRVEFTVTLGNSNTPYGDVNKPDVVTIPNGGGKGGSGYPTDGGGGIGYGGGWIPQVPVFPNDEL